MILAALVFLQTTTGETTAPVGGGSTTQSGPSASCAADPKCLYLDPDQLVYLSTHMQSNTFYIAGLIGMVVFCVGLSMLIQSVGGR
jgi:hypothetical protein